MKWLLKKEINFRASPDFRQDKQNRMFALIRD